MGKKNKGLGIEQIYGPDARSKRAGWLSAVSFCFCFCMGGCQVEPERMKRRASTVRNLCQGAAGDNIAGWKRLSGCCADF
jgi:hypothetical protein